MKPNILKIHEEVFNFLYRIHQTDESFLFQIRKYNKGKRLDQGFWFRGDMNYLCVTFWSGNDWKEKIYPINFVIFSNKNSSLELSGQDNKDNANFISLIAKKLKCEKHGKKEKWYKYYDDSDYINSLASFVEKEKPVVDRLIKEQRPKFIGFLNAPEFKKNIDNKLYYERKLLDYGSKNKIAKICWNTNNWQRPSGPLGKSLSSEFAYEADFGYGHEEWLLDKSRVIDGYHYGFLKPLNVASRKHDENIYNIDLFSHNNNGRSYYIGQLRNAICITSDESNAVYHKYVENNWIEEMRNEVKAVGGNTTGFDNTHPNEFFNIKFRLSEAKLVQGAPELIAEDDINITSLHYKLLSKKCDFWLDRFESEEENLGAGKLRYTESSVRTFSGEAEFDPYHGKMQNALLVHLKQHKKIYGYSDIYIEAGRVDIKAKTTNGMWHYYEIKTDNAKLSIRKAIGQLLEYCYFSSSKRALKLIIVSDDIPDDDVRKYMIHIRSLTGLNIFYKYFDINSNFLSEDY